MKGHKKMTISLKKALKSPLEKGFLFPCVILYILAILNMWFANSEDIVTVVSVLCVGALCQLTLLGYSLSFSHKVIQKSSVLFNYPSLSTLGYGVKAFIFGILCYVFLGLMALPIYLLVLIKAPFWMTSFVLIFELLFAFLYIMSAWTKFIDTTRMLQPLKLIDTTVWLALNWRAYFKLVMYMFGTTLLLIVPIFAVKFISAIITVYFSPFYSTHLFILIATQAYMSFVVAHIMAQGYIGMKDKMEVDMPAKEIQSQTAKTPKKEQPIKKVPQVKEATKTKSVKSASKKNTSKPTKKAK